MGFGLWSSPHKQVNFISSTCGYCCTVFTGTEIVPMTIVYTMFSELSRVTRDFGGVPVEFFRVQRSWNV